MNWVNTSDSLPPDNEDVLAYLTSGLLVLQYVEKGKWMSYGVETARGDTVERWASFPRVSHTDNATVESILNEAVSLDLEGLVLTGVENYVSTWLEDNDFDGLVEAHSQCACRHEDLAPCGHIHKGCRAGHVDGCDDTCGLGCDWHIVAGRKSDK